MRNVLKYAQQCQNGIFKKNVSGNNGTFNIQLCGSPLNIMYTLEVWESQ